MLSYATLRGTSRDFCACALSSSLAASINEHPDVCLLKPAQPYHVLTLQVLVSTHSEASRKGMTRNWNGNGIEEELAD